MDVPSLESAESCGRSRWSGETELEVEVSRLEVEGVMAALLLSALARALFAATSLALLSFIILFVLQGLLSAISETLILFGDTLPR